MVDKVKLEITPSASTTFPGDEFLMEPSERREKKLSPSRAGSKGSTVRPT